MQIIFHTGAHCTDDDGLLRCLLRNKVMLSERGIGVPGPSTYRQILAETFSAMENTVPSEEARDVLIDAILDDEVADRLVMSNQHFFGPQRLSVREAKFYPRAPQRISQMKELFIEDDVQVFMSIRNPATFLPAVTKIMPARRAQNLLEGCQPSELRWSELLTRIRTMVPDVPLTVWCNEDMPLLWGQVLRELAGLDMSVEIDGDFDLLNEIMTEEGMLRLKAYLKKHPELNEMQTRRVIAAFLDKFAKEDELEEELDMPGWTENFVDDLTDAYDEDLYRIERMPGVTLISP